MVVTLYFEYLMYLSYWLLTLFLCECWINLSIYNDNKEVNYFQILLIDVTIYI